MNIHLLRKNLLLSLGAGLLGLLGAALLPAPVSAAGEVYTWKDFRTITVSGGDVKTPSDIILTNTPPSGDTMAVFSGNILYNKGTSPKGCTVSIQIYLFKSNGTGGGRIWNPPPYDGTVIGDPNAPPRCALAGAPEMDPPLHDQWVTIGGTRPADPNAPEREEEKRFDVYVFAPDPLSKVPASDTITIYKSDGTRVGSQTSPFHDDSGQANWPPDQTPAALQVTFSLEPGDYVVCDTYVAKECNYAKAPANQKFKKEKYKSSSIQLGTPFQTPDKKRINIHVNYHSKIPCGSSLDVNPVTVEITGPTGDKSQVVQRDTTSGHIGADLPGEEDALCTKDVSVGLDAVMDNAAPGEYKFCTTGAQCVVANKVDGQGLTVTLEVNQELSAPPDQKVCTTGDGIAGALAWIICPAVQLIAGATEFFENNIIVPFMTVSPLTTNNSNPVYILWQRVRDVSNVGFVIFLLLSIFSVAMGKYGAKRLLPRIFIVAIGINLVSYFGAAFLIDAFNVFGAGVSQLVMSALQQAGTTQLNSGTSAGPVRSIFTLGGAALLTVLLSGGAALGWLFSFIGLAAFALLVFVVTLVVRQMLIIGLVIASPLLILLYLLPNFARYSKKGGKLFIQLLLMYPGMILLFASGKIFGFILQQPDFKIGGDGVSDEVGQSVRVILVVVVYILPVGLAPFLLTFSGQAMKGTFSLLNNARIRRAAQQPGKSFQENVVKPKRQELQMRAARRGGRIGQLAGLGMRREFKREQREHELQHAKQEYIAHQVTDNERLARSASGIGGQAGITRVQGAAVSNIEKARKQEAANEAAIFTHELRRLGLSTKEFNNAFSSFLQSPANNTVTGKLRDENGNLRTIDLTQRTDLTRSALNSAAQAGEITTLEQARMSSGIDQSMLDEVIRNNEGAIKGKGGYHLATNFNLAHGRSQGTLRDIHIARLRNSFAAGGEDIAGMKASFVSDVARTLANPATRAAILTGPGGLTAAERQSIRDNIDSLLSSPDISGGAKNIDALRNIRNSI